MCLANKEVMSDVCRSYRLGPRSETYGTPNSTPVQAVQESPRTTKIKSNTRLYCVNDKKRQLFYKQFIAVIDASMIYREKVPK